MFWKKFSSAFTADIPLSMENREVHKHGMQEIGQNELETLVFGLDVLLADLSTALSKVSNLQNGDASQLSNTLGKFLNAPKKQADNRLLKRKDGALFTNIKYTNLNF